MTTFEPFPGRIHFQPDKEKGILLAVSGDVQESGTVINPGTSSFFKEGDTITFLRWGAEVTPEIDGKEYWTVREDVAFITGRARNHEQV